MGWVTNARGGLAITRATAEAIADAIMGRYEIRRWGESSYPDETFWPELVEFIIATAKETKS